MPPVRTGEDIEEPRSSALKARSLGGMALPTGGYTLADIAPLSAYLRTTHIAYDPLRWVVSSFDLAALGCVDDTNTAHLSYILALYALWRDMTRARPHTWETLPLPPGFDSLVRLIPALEVRLDARSVLHAAGGRCANCAALDDWALRARLEHGWIGCWSCGGPCASCVANQLRCEPSHRRRAVDDKILALQAGGGKVEGAEERYERIAADVRRRFAHEIWAPELARRIEAERAQLTQRRPATAGTRNGKAQPRFWATRPPEPERKPQSPRRSTTSSPELALGLGERAMEVEGEVGGDRPRRGTYPPDANGPGAGSSTRFQTYPPRSSLPQQPHPRPSPQPQQPHPRRHPQPQPQPQPPSPGPPRFHPWARDSLPQQQVQGTASSQGDTAATDREARAEVVAAAIELDVSMNRLFAALQEMRDHAPETTRRLRKLMVSSDTVVRRAVERGVVQGDAARQWSVVIQSFDGWMHATPEDRGKAGQALLRDVGPLRGMVGRALDKLGVGEAQDDG